VLDDVVTVLADDAEFPSEIDAAQARGEVESLAAALAEESESTERVAALLRDYRRAEVRVAVAGS
jgi:F0F1-type ATP synthase epsilon subunit